MRNAERHKARKSRLSNSTETDEAYGSAWGGGSSAQLRSAQQERREGCVWPFPFVNQSHRGASIAACHKRKHDGKIGDYRRVLSSRVRGDGES